MNRSPSKAPSTQRFTLKHRREDVEHAEHAVLAALEAHGYEGASLFAIRMALEEALSNGFKHGNKDDAAKTVRFEFRIDDSSVHFDIEDQGEGFDPHSVPDPTQDENMEIPCGRGLKLMHAFMTSVHIDPPGNRVRMSYIKNADAMIGP